MDSSIKIDLEKGYLDEKYYPVIKVQTPDTQKTDGLDVRDKVMLEFFNSMKGSRWILCEKKDNTYYLRPISPDDFESTFLDLLSELALKRYHADLSTWSDSEIDTLQCFLDMKREQKKQRELQQKMYLDYF